jgi:hypothetical protein
MVNKTGKTPLPALASGYGAETQNKPLTLPDLNR